MAGRVVSCTTLENLPVTDKEAAAAVAAVHEMLGPGQEVVSVEKNVCVREEEVLLVNGTPITLEGEEGQAIKECLLKGTIPNQDLINHLLLKAGLLMRPVKVKTELNVKSSHTLSENVYLHKNGTILDENSREKVELNEYSSRVEEDWLPVTAVEAELPGCGRTQERDGDRLLPEAGKSLRDRLKSTDSELVKERLESLCMDKAPSAEGGKVNSQESLDVSFESVFSKSFDGDSSGGGSDRERTPGVTWRDGVIVSGTLEDLIHEMVPRAHTAPSDSFTFSFLLSSRLYITPTQLLSEVCRRADQLSHMMSGESLPSFVSNLVRMLSNWITWFPYDFQEESMMTRVRKLAQLCNSRDPTVQTRLTQLLQSLLKHLTAVEKHRQYISKIRRIQQDGEIYGVPTDMSGVGLAPAAVAQQLTHLELQHLSFIGPDEFVNAFAKEALGSSTDGLSRQPTLPELQPEAVEARLRAGKKTPHLEAYIAWFNRLSQLVASSACLLKKKKQRVRVIEFWIEVARECVNIGNFNSMMGIISGLNLGPVSRLKKTWAKIQSGKFDVLGHQMDPSSNFVSYRTTLQAAVTRSEKATDKKQRVVIPFFSLLLKDLYFVNEGCASKLPNGHLNMEKARALAEHVSQFMKWKDMECPYEKNSRILDYFERSAAYSSDALEMESYLCEPPDTQQDRDQYKSLKHAGKKS